jgi:hypothetical protein
MDSQVKAWFQQLAKFCVRVWFVPQCPWYNQLTVLGWDDKNRVETGHKIWTCLDDPTYLIKSNQLRQDGTCWNPRETAASKCSEAAMATLITLVLAAIGFGVLFGAFVSISFAIRRDDRRGSLRWDAPTHSAKAARSLVGLGGSRWDD